VNVKEIEWKKKDSASGNKKRRQLNIYLLKMDILENYGNQLKNLNMVVYLKLLKSFLNVGQINKNYMVLDVLILVSK
jgi:hypothetical protein